MNRDSAITLVLAVLCISAAGVSATTMQSTLSQEPDDVVDIDFSKLPIGEDEGKTAKGALQSDGDTQGQTGKDGTEGDVESSDSGDDGDQSQSSQANPEGEMGKAGSNDQSGDSGSNDQRDGQSGGGDGKGSQYGGEPGLLQQLLNLLMDLLPFLLLVVLLALAYRYRHHLLALVLALASVFGDRETAATASGSAWPSEAPDNDVHRAWLTMVSETGIDEPRRRTPAECAAAAIEAGLDPAAVRTVTETFEEVRYGGAPVTDERRERARRGLDRLGGGGSA